MNTSDLIAVTFLPELSNGNMLNLNVTYYMQVYGPYNHVNYRGTCSSGGRSGWPVILVSLAPSVHLSKRP